MSSGRRLQLPWRKGGLVPILIVEPDRDYQATAAALIKWADRRHRVHLAEDGCAAWKLALEVKPELVIVSLDLPDISAADFSTRLRAKLPATTFIAYAAGDHKHLSTFDGVLNKPPQRTAMLAFINQAKKKRKESVVFGISELNAHQRSRVKPDDGPFKPVRISVGISGEDMRFSTTVADGCTIGTALRQLGKLQITSFSLVRNGDHIDAGLLTQLQQDDLILISGASQPVRRV
jgi:CheY-like chemotaxis protein